MHDLGSYSLKDLLIDVFLIRRKLVVNFFKSRYDVVRLCCLGLKISEKLFSVSAFVGFVTQSYNHIILQYFLQQQFFLISQYLLQLIGTKLDSKFIFSDVAVVNRLNLLDQVFNQLTFLISLIELTEIGVCTHNETFYTSNFQSLDVIVAGIDKVVIKYSQLWFFLLLRSLIQHFLELQLNIINSC